MKKHTIWGNIDLNIEDWRGVYREWLEANDIEDRDPDDEDAIYDWMVETNNYYLDDERCNLDRVVDGRILVIGDIGRWNGRISGYRIISSGNIGDILYSECDYAEWYSDGHNIRSVGIHHDGRNYAEYRVIREDRNIENLLNDIYDGKEISRAKLNYYTRSLHPYVARVYGWR